MAAGRGSAGGARLAGVGSRRPGAAAPRPRTRRSGRCHAPAAAGRGSGSRRPAPAGPSAETGERRDARRGRFGAAPGPAGQHREHQGQGHRRDREDGASRRSRRDAHALDLESHAALRSAREAHALQHEARARAGRGGPTGAPRRRRSPRRASGPRPRGAGGRVRPRGARCDTGWPRSDSSSERRRRATASSFVPGRAHPCARRERSGRRPARGRRAGRGARPSRRGERAAALTSSACSRHAGRGPAEVRQERRPARSRTAHPRVVKAAPPGGRRPSRTSRPSPSRTSGPGTTFSTRPEATSAARKRS